MPRINEATDTDLKVIEELRRLGWKAGDTLLYQQEYALSQEYQKMFDGRKSIKPDVTLTDMNGNILAVIENKFDDEKKALTKLRTLYAAVLRPRFLYACSPHRILFYDMAWKDLGRGYARYWKCHGAAINGWLKRPCSRRERENEQVVIEIEIEESHKRSIISRCW